MPSKLVSLVHFEEVNNHCPQFNSPYLLDNDHFISQDSLTMPVHPYYCAGSGSSKTPSPSTTSSQSKHVPEIYHFTLCPHTSPPVNRPLNVQPKPPSDLVTGKLISTISGRCPQCDDKFRRDAETEIVHRILDQVLQVERQYSTPNADHKCLDGQVMDLYARRNTEVKDAWKGYTQRWGIGCIEQDWDGRMILGWIRQSKYGEGIECNYERKEDHVPGGK